MQMLLNGIYAKAILSIVPHIVCMLKLPNLGMNCKHTSHVVHEINCNPWAGCRWWHWRGALRKQSMGNTDHPSHYSTPAQPMDVRLCLCVCACVVQMPISLSATECRRHYSHYKIKWHYARRRVWRDVWPASVLTLGLESMRASAKRCANGLRSCMANSA